MNQESEELYLQYTAEIRPLALAARNVVMYHITRSSLLRIRFMVKSYKTGLRGIISD
jgi:hypothetical protein